MSATVRVCKPAPAAAEAEQGWSWVGSGAVGCGDGGAASGACSRRPPALSNGASQPTGPPRRQRRAAFLRAPASRPGPAGHHTGRRRSARPGPHTGRWRSARPGPHTGRWRSARGPASRWVPRWRTATGLGSSGPTRPEVRGSSVLDGVADSVVEAWSGAQRATNLDGLVPLQTRRCHDTIPNPMSGAI